MKVYFEVRGGGGGETDIKAYVSPKRYSYGYCGYEYDLFGKRHEFTWVAPDDARVYDHSELPADMWYSIRHGQNDFTVDESKEETWQLSDLRYDRVDRKKVRSTLKGLKLIDGCKSTGDVYDVWKEYMKDSYLPFEFVQKAFSIMQQGEIPMVNGELGFYGMQNTFLFLELMEKEGQKRENITTNMSEKVKQAIQVGCHVTELMRLPCVYSCHKEADGKLCYLLYDWDAQGRYVKAHEGQWLCEGYDGKWTVTDDSPTELNE